MRTNCYSLFLDYSSENLSYLPDSTQNKLILYLQSLTDSLDFQSVSDSLAQKVKDFQSKTYKPAPPPSPGTYMNFTLDAFLNILGTINHNAPTYTEPNNMVFYYSLTFENRLTIQKKLYLNTYYFYEFGNRYFFDTIPSSIINDRWDFNNKILIPFGFKNFSFSLSINTTSQYRNQYDYRTNDEGVEERYLYTSAGSPKYTTYSGGFNYDFWDRSSVDFSLASAKRTKIKNQRLFDTRETDYLYGIEKGNNKLIEYGFNITLQIGRQKIFKNFYWENYTETFIQAKQYQAFKHTTIDMKNIFHYIFFSYFRLSFKTDLRYDTDIYDKKPFITNQLMLGVYFNNRM